MRAVSTVLDVALCLLLLSASALVLAGAGPPPKPDGGDTADATATMLATSTGRVEYALVTPAADASSDGDTDDADESAAVAQRTAHDTLAGLLADCATGDTAIDDTELTPRSDDFERRVAAAVRRSLDRPEQVSAGRETDPGGTRDDPRAQVVARWEPYPGAAIGGRCTVGASPPPTAAVHAATIRVPSGMSTGRTGALVAARNDGFTGVAEVVSRGVVTGLFPGRETRLAYRSRTKNATMHRLRRMATLTNANVGTALADDDLRTVRRSLVDSLAARLERELRRLYETPAAAARAISVAEVRIVVRTWSA